MTVKSVKISGKDYVMVADRVTAFREKMPEGTITTELLHYDEKHAVVKAVVSFGEFILGTGHALCTREMARQAGGRYIEKAETSAIGRALSASGFGTSSLLEDEDEQYFADSPREPKAPSTPPPPRQNPTGGKQQSARHDFSQTQFLRTVKRDLPYYKSDEHIMNTLRLHPDFDSGFILDFPDQEVGAWQWLEQHQNEKED